jgi:hypothetical protein
MAAAAAAQFRAADETGVDCINATMLGISMFRQRKSLSRRILLNGT